MSLTSLMLRRELEDEQSVLNHEISSIKLTLERHLNLKSRKFYKKQYKLKKARLDIVASLLAE